jgi:phosphomethylpyrimidine synthase
MALIGCSHQRDLAAQIKKLDALADLRNRPTIVADLSIVGRNELVAEIVTRGFVAAALPIYAINTRQQAVDTHELLDRAVMQMDLGARVLTIHPTPSRELVDHARQRLVPWTSRGGGLVIADLVAGGQTQNAYLRILPDLLPHARRTGTALSLGASFRSANIFDSRDAVQQAEILVQVELANTLRRAEVASIIESPGHARPRDILEIARTLSPTGFPIMPLGPIPTDAAVGQDHISASIGATLMGLSGAAHVLAAVTREEHTGGVPSLESTVEAVEAAWVSAHIIDIEMLEDTSADSSIVRARAEKATCVDTKATPGCARCADKCPLVWARDARNDVAR